MASIIKNQIIKHLSSFARNLRPEHITVEVLRGKGQLRDLELNEEVLTERLELPPWLKIVSANCSSVSVKIPWTRLKSAPVELFVEELRVTIRLVAASAASNLRKLELNVGKAYDLAERVIEGISLHVQCIEIYFETDSQSKINFGGSIMLSQFVLESRTPKWQQERNINMTRIHDKTNRQVLFFKYISWRVLKIEASSSQKGSDFYSTGQPRRSSLNSPLRFLTENGRCKITIKKSSLDCSLIAGRIELILEEIHWLAYMAHLRSAIDFYKHILDLANSVGRENPLLLAKQQHQPTFTSTLHHSTPTKPQGLQMQRATLNPKFAPFDIAQSSHHLTIARIDLHLCDDSSTDDLPPDWNIDSGAMQATVQRLKIDFYPQHRVFEQNGEFSHRHSWLRYSTPNPFTDLAKTKLDQHFRTTSCKMEPNMLDRFVRIWPQLCSQNVVIRVENLILQSVSERSTKKDALKCLFTMNKRAKERLPDSLSFFHLEVSSHSFPATNAFPVPPNSIHLMLAPFDLAPDPKSVRWLVYAFESILNSFETPQISNQNLPAGTCSDDKKPEIRIELVMPKVILSPAELPNTALISTAENANSQNAVDSRIPKRLLIQTSTIFLSNFILLNDPFVPLPLMFKEDGQSSTSTFIKWAERNIPASLLLRQLERRSSSSAGIESMLDSADEWFISIPSLWFNSDFGPDTWELPFLNDLSFLGSITSDEKTGNNILLEPRTDIGLALDHFQYIQLLQLIDGISALLDQINSDRRFFHKSLDNLNSPDPPLSIYFQCEKLHLRLILPIGPAPSPYDFPAYTNKNLENSPTTTSISYSADLPHDETINSGLATNSTLGRKKVTAEAKGSSSALADTFAQSSTDGTLPSNASATAEIVGGLAVQTGLRTVDSLAELSTVSVTNRLPAELVVSKKQLIGPTNLPDFAATTPTPSDLESNIDDNFSTSSSTEQNVFDITNAEYDASEVDVDEAVEAEEAVESDDAQDIRALKQKARFLGRSVNVFDVLLENLNVHVRAAAGLTTALAFATNIHVGERLNLVCDLVYKEKGSTFDVPVSLEELKRAGQQNADILANPMEQAKLKFQLHSAPRQSIVKVDIDGLDVSLNEEIVSQLAPFIQNPTEDENPPSVELNLQKCKIEIKNPKKRFPLHIKFGEISIQDGPENE